jgi:hypothetical protein
MQEVLWDSAGMVQGFAFLFVLRVGCVQLANQMAGRNVDRLTQQQHQGASRQKQNNT